MAKKLEVYPMPCQLAGGTTFNATIIKLTSSGMLVSSMQPLKVNDGLTIRFVLPVKNLLIESPVVVYKTYSNFKGQHGLVNPGSHVAELMLRNTPIDVKNTLIKWLAWLKGQQI